MPFRDPLFLLVVLGGQMSAAISDDAVTMIRVAGGQRHDGVADQRMDGAGGEGDEHARVSPNNEE